MTRLDNPAGRLHGLLKEAMTFSTESAARVVWADVLGISKNDIPRLLDGYSEVLRLPLAIRTEVAKVEHVNPDTYLRGLPTLEKTLNDLSLGVKWAEFESRIGEEEMVSLEICSDLLSQHRKEPVLAEEEEEELLSQVRELVIEVAAANLPEDLKESTLISLSDIERALLLNKVSGAREIRRRVWAAVGDVVSNPQTPAASDNSTFKKVAKFMKHLAVVLSIGVNTLQLSEGIFGPDPELKPSIEVEVDVDAHVEGEGGTLPETDEGGGKPLLR